MLLQTGQEHDDSNGKKHRDSFADGQAHGHATWIGHAHYGHHSRTPTNSTAKYRRVSKLSYFIRLISTINPILKYDVNGIKVC